MDGEFFLIEQDLEKKKISPQGPQLAKRACIRPIKTGQSSKFNQVAQGFVYPSFENLHQSPMLYYSPQWELHVQSENVFAATFIHCFSYFHSAPPWKVSIFSITSQYVVEKYKQLPLCLCFSRLRKPSSLNLSSHTICPSCQLFQWSSAGISPVCQYLSCAYRAPFVLSI